MSAKLNSTFLRRLADTRRGRAILARLAKGGIANGCRKLAGPFAMSYRLGIKGI